MVRLYKLVYRLILLFYHIMSTLTDVANVDMGLVKPMTGDHLSICNALVMVNHTKLASFPGLLHLLFLQYAKQSREGLGNLSM